MKYSWIVFLLALPLSAQAQLRLDRVFSDNMLLQRDQPLCVMGKAAPGQRITVQLGTDIQSALTKKDSSWCACLPAQQANPDPQNLTVSAGTEKIEIQNILIGDVWLCIGQSNMEYAIANEIHFRQEIPDSHQPLIRFYNPTYAGKNIYGTAYTDSVIRMLVTEKFYQGRWQLCDSNSFKTMSAVAYYFGKTIQGQTGVPVGLINLSIGGAPLETFIDENALKKSRQFASKTNGDWLLNDALPVWIRERGTQNVGTGENVPADRPGKNHPYKPGFAYASGIQPLLFMGIRGVICYQGESNAQEMERVNEYPALSKLMVEDYRKKWKNPRLPFYFVQLSSIDTVNYKGSLWPQFRNEQRRMLESIRYSGMAVTSDIGARDNVHPADKKTVGERLARWALDQTYGQQVVPSGPLPVKATYSNGKVCVSFRFAPNGLETSDGSPVRGFSLDGKNEVEAHLNGKNLVISVNHKPDSVYYGWKPFSDGNLVNTEKLPASTFRIKVR